MVAVLTCDTSKCRRYAGGREEQLQVKPSWKCAVNTSVYTQELNEPGRREREKEQEPQHELGLPSAPQFGGRGTSGEQLSALLYTSKLFKLFFFVHC